ncbi:putative RecB family nuclease [Cryobacterium mesophilum]|uniref:TM0106 family RecB-like putative nuclease n=1 Tax=Terrimesophilobacter mesophilus TaxID=433647 RepID=A0A4R8VA28_9MICO|nr:TM0106 family RecB-like putative nuclease [Terrimesophilobacter mesophilus]MBB5633305.1 putative RecB family nuclease [Terrimesophilobacter mesophilus]TFB80044.1 TM0106 family RecB-like putative nuclease [Terrimesophilobacter mesophilus]
MYLLDENTLVTSASDLKLASECEFAFLRMLDYRLGRIDAAPTDDDPMLLKAGELGGVRELAQLAQYREQYGDRVIEIAHPEPRDRDTLRIAASSTLEALQSGAPVVFQGTFFDETEPNRPFIGYADFIVLRPDGRYRVQDTKLARSSKPYMQDQLALYHEQLERLGVPVDDIVEILLGDGTSVEHDIADLRAGLVKRRDRMRELVAEHLAEAGPVEWGDDRYTADRRCVHCVPEAEAVNDVTLVANLLGAQRLKLRAVGIRTVADLAAAIQQPAGGGIPARTYAKLQNQARLQHAAAQHPESLPPLEVVDPALIAALPPHDPGDLFFDFEGDPMSSEGSGDTIEWDLDYLWGVIDVEEQFTPFWAHTLEEEKAALLDFLELVESRLTAYPSMHVYHYASHEITHLKKIAARHDVGEGRVAALIEGGLFVDLLKTVRGALQIGLRSYSLKKIEPLYMGDELRSDDGVTTAVGSVEEYWKAREAMDAGNAAEAQTILDRIADYNRYDCVSTLRLRNWLKSLPEPVSIRPAAPDYSTSGHGVDA